MLRLMKLWKSCTDSVIKFVLVSYALDLMVTEGTPMILPMMRKHTTLLEMTNQTIVT
ncbi:hypothetical protein MKW92_014366, partial [Papaver armeniacum]